MHGIAFICTIVFIALKLSAVIFWPWWAVFFPVYIILGIWLFMGLMMLVGWLIGRRVNARKLRKFQERRLRGFNRK